MQRRPGTLLLIRPLRKIPVSAGCGILLKCCRPVSGGSIWEAADDDDKGDKQPGPSSEWRSRVRQSTQRRHRPSAWDEERESDESDDGRAPRGGGNIGKYNSRAKWRRKQTPSSDQEEPAPCRANGRAGKSNPKVKQQRQ